ncbi:MAG: porin [bacterium]
MNKKLIAAAVSAAVVAPVASQADITVYGRVNNAIDLDDLSDAPGADSTTDVSGVVSRFGLKGNADIGNGLTAHGHYEFWTTSDKEGPGVNDTRIATVGLSGAFGRVDVGNQWSAYFNTFGTLVSPTYSLGYYLYSSVGGGPFRASNTIKYSNSFGPLSAQLDIRLNESDEQSDVAEKINGDGVGLGLSFAVNDNITIAAAFDSEDAQGNGAPALIRFSADENSAAVTSELDATNTDGEHAPVLGSAAVNAAGNNIIATVDKTYNEGAFDEGRAGDFDVDADRVGIAVKANFGGFWASLGWQNYETDDLNIYLSGTVDVNDDGVVDTDDDTTTGSVTDGIIDEGVYAVDGSDIDTMFLYGGGSFGERTSWMLGYSKADDAVDSDAQLIGDNLIFGTDDSTQVTWAIYHNLGGGLKMYYEATSVDSENTAKDGARHLLGMRVDF